MHDLENEIESLLVQIDNAMSNETKLKKLHFSRNRLVSDLRHSIEEANKLTEQSKRLLVVCKDRTLERYWTDFKTNLESIVVLTEALDDQDSFFATNQALEDQYHNAKVHLDTLVSPDEEGPDLDRTFFNNHGANNGENGGNGNGYGNYGGGRMHRSHLPDIKFQPFDGAYDNWNRFSQMFTKLIGKEKLDSIDKLYYLNQSLKGEPLQLIKHLPMSEDGFENAWKLLRENYEVRRHIVNSQFKTFFSMARMTTENSVQLRAMLQTCLECQSAFTSLNIDAQTIGLMMTYYCALQMDSETSRQWEIELKHHSDEPKLSELISFLQMRCRLLDLIEKRTISKPQPIASKSEKSQPKTVKTFLSQNDKSPEYKCYVCDANHKTFQCPILLAASVEDRLKTVVDKKLCFNCLFPHRADECKSRYSCHKCQKRHHSLLHTGPRHCLKFERSSRELFRPSPRIQ